MQYKWGIGTLHALVPLVISSDVNEVICTLDQSKASGCDDLPVRMLVDAKEFVSEPLAFIMNLSFSTGIFFLTNSKWLG